MIPFSHGINILYKIFQFKCSGNDKKVNIVRVLLYHLLTFLENNLKDRVSTLEINSSGLKGLTK